MRYILNLFRRAITMAIQRKRADITSADSKQIGFDYQYLYFIVKLLHLSPGEEVGYEELDDVHTISFREQKTYFYQLKHTIMTNAGGQQSNLTLFSEDLWKTLSNWSKMITDPVEGREKRADQKDFLNKSCFKFVVNRNTQNNDFILQVEKLKKKEIDKKDFLKYVSNLYNLSKDASIKQYIKDLINLNAVVLEYFITRIEFISSPDDLFMQIRYGIRDKMILEEYLDDVFGGLLLQLKKDFFNKVTSGKHQAISYNEWISKYQSVFNQYRTTPLPLRVYSRALPDHLEKQNFVKELIEIGAVDLNDDGLAEIAELTNHYIQVKLQLEEWYEEGRITYSVLKQFHKDAKLQWKNIHRSCHRTTNKNAKLDFENALDCFDKIMYEKLSLLSTELGTSMSNGEFIKLADENKIGWKYCWKDRYYSNGD